MPLQTRKTQTKTSTIMFYVFGSLILLPAFFFTILNFLCIPRWITSMCFSMTLCIFRVIIQPKLIAHSKSVTFINPKAPVYPRLAQGKSWNEVSIIFVFFL